MARDLIYLKPETKKMNFKNLLLLNIFLLSNILISQSYSYNEKKEFIVSGSVTNIENGDPLEYATITLLDPENNNVITGGLSDEAGNFKISSQKGMYNVFIELREERKVFKQYHLVLDTTLISMYNMF